MRSDPLIQHFSKSGRLILSTENAFHFQDHLSFPCLNPTKVFTLHSCNSTNTPRPSSPSLPSTKHPSVAGTNSNRGNYLCPETTIFSSVPVTCVGNKSCHVHLFSLSSLDCDTFYLQITHMSVYSAHLKVWYIRLIQKLNRLKKMCLPETGGWKTK